MNNKNQETVLVSVASERAEIIAGVLIAFFAALMAISELVNNNLEEEMMIAYNKQNSYFAWYQSKSIKESLKENELETLETLKFSLGDTEILKSKIESTKIEIERYGKEKTEILLGSANILESDWVQDLDGEMGVIIGVKEWEVLAIKMDNATQKFDIGMLFFQISLVLGAVCIVIYDNPTLQRSFVALVIICGILGISFSIWGYQLSL